MQRLQALSRTSCEFLLAAFLAAILAMRQAPWFPNSVQPGGHPASLRTFGRMKRCLLLFMSCSAPVMLAACAVPAPKVITIVTIRVTTELPGLGSEATEALITVPLESMLIGLPSLQQMNSMSAHGSSTIWLDFDGIASRDALRVVNEALAGTTSRLPPKVNGPVVTRSSNPRHR